MTMIPPRAKHDHDYPVGNFSAAGRRSVDERDECERATMGKWEAAAAGGSEGGDSPIAARAKHPNVPANGHGTEFF